MMSDPDATDDGYHLIDYTSDPFPTHNRRMWRDGTWSVAGSANRRPTEWPFIAIRHRQVMCPNWTTSSSGRYKGSNLLYQSVPFHEPDDWEWRYVVSLLTGSLKRRIRFNVRAQSMGQLGFSSGRREAIVTDQKESAKKVEPQSAERQQRWAVLREFSFISYGSPAKNRPVVFDYANASHVIRRIDQKKNNSSDASS